MKALRGAAFMLLAGGLLVLASGAVLGASREMDPPLRYLVGGGLLSLALASGLYVWRREDPPSSMSVYWMTLGVIAAVHLTGGGASVLYPFYFLLLLWVALPSVGVSATGTGFLVGLVDCLAVMLAAVTDSEGPFLDALAGSLLPALGLLATPLLFGLAAEWLMDAERTASLRERLMPGGEGLLRRSQPRPAGGGECTALVRLLHRAGNADITCMLGARAGAPLRPTACVPGGAVRRPLRQDGRLARMVAGADCPLVIRAESEKEIAELSPSGGSTHREGGSVWILAASAGTGRESSSGTAGILVQEHGGGEPSDREVSLLGEAAAMMAADPSEGGTEERSAIGLVSELVGAAAEGMNAVVTTATSVLSGALDGATVSVAHVDGDGGHLRIWAARGPLATGGRRRIWSVEKGVAGWVVRNRAPCRRSGPRDGGRGITAFGSGDGHSEEAGSCLGVPVMASGEVFAVIIAEHDEPEAFDGRTEELLAAVATIASMTADRTVMAERQSDMAERDPLTGMHRLSWLQERMRPLAGGVKLRGGSVGLLAVDFDRFGELCSSLGYRECDALMKRAADRLRRSIPDNSLFARSGPDGFAICLPGADMAELEAVALRVSEALGWPYDDEKSGGIEMSVSIGGSYTRTDRDVLRLIPAAEEALARARESGPGGMVLRPLGRTAARESGR